MAGMTHITSRLKLLRIDERDLIDALVGAWNPPPGFVRVTRCPDVPPDARLVGISHDPLTRSFLIKIEHGSFPEVLRGEYIPYFPGLGLFTQELVRVAPPDPAPDVIAEMRP
jgi:hypothetical protein